MKRLRFSMLGVGFWSRFQLSGWAETGGVSCVAVADPQVEIARQLLPALKVGARIYSDSAELLRREQVDFVDIVASPETHCALVHLAAEHRLPVICQKPMAPSLREAEAMVACCRDAGVPFYIHENWRWQAPIRRIKQILDAGAIGSPYRARLRMASAFPVFRNQPSLKQLERFLLLDMGSHILDVARFLFGEPASVYASTQRVQADVRGEDAATVVLHFTHGAVVSCEMGYAGAPIETDFFPQTFVLIEGERGSVELAPDYWVRITTAAGTEAVRAAPARFPWADPAYEVVHAGIVPCLQNLLAGLRGEHPPETTSADNLRTMRIVFAAYESAAKNEVVSL